MGRIPIRLWCGIFNGLLAMKPGADSEEGSSSAGYAIACVGGGFECHGTFFPFLEDASVKMVGVEAGAKAFRRAGTPRVFRAFARSVARDTLVSIAG